MPTFGAIAVLTRATAAASWAARLLRLMVVGQQVMQPVFVRRLSSTMAGVIWLNTASCAQPKRGMLSSGSGLGAGIFPSG